MDKIELYEKIVLGSEKGMKLRNRLLEDFRDEERRKQILENPIHKNYLDDIIRTAEGYRKESIKVLPWHLFKGFDTTGNRIEYEKEYFEHRGRLMSFGLLSWLYRNPSDIEALEDTICAICEEYTWSLPAHLQSKSLEPEVKDVYQEGRLKQLGFNPEIHIDLFAAETAFALSEILAILEEELSPIVVHRAKKEIFRRVLFSYLNFPGIYNWETMKNNWCAVCAGSIGMAGIYLIEDDSMLATLLHRLSPTLDHFLDSFEKDGACLEGLSYWTYGVSFYVAYADLLSRRTAGEIDLLNTKHFENIACFQQKCYFPGGWTVSFSDASTKDCYRSGLTSYLKRKFDGVIIPPDSNKADYLFDHCFRWCHGYRDLIWTTTHIEKNIADTTYDILPEAQWMLCKKNTGDLLGLAVKGGHNGEPHNHNDVGSFMFFKDRECLLTDIGCGEYTKEYFGNGRYSIFCNSSFGHSVPIVNGDGQKEGEFYAAKEVTFQGKHRMTMDISGAYNSNGLLNLIRDISFHEETGIRIVDTYRVTSEINNITERFITLFPPLVTEDAVMIKGDKTECSIRYDRSQMTPRVRMHDHRDHGGNHVTVYSIDFEILVQNEVVLCEFTIY